MPIPERLYNLLPGIYQSYDALQGEPLRALLALLEQELALLEADTDRLYDNWFIETCEDWVVPYIGDLLDAQRLYSRSPRRGQERRAFVANTLAYRRHKGTATVLEQLALNISGWHGRAVEYLPLLARTPGLITEAEMSPATVDLRRSSQLATLGSPFETGSSFTVDVRSGQNQGSYHPTDIGLFLWRLQSYPLTRVTARSIDLGSGKWRGHCYSFSPLGDDRLPLFNQPQTKALVTAPTAAIHVPDRLSGATLAQEIQWQRQQRARGIVVEPQGYFGRNPVLQIILDGQTDALLPEQLLITNLDGWESPHWQLPQPIDESELPTVRYEVAVDPELGRLAILHRPLPRRVEVSFAYGFSDDMGGGPYSRPPVPTVAQPVVWQVRQEAPFTENPLVAAIEQWHQTTATWQACREQLYLPLAKLTVPTLPWIDLDTSVRPEFKPGIITGLEVLAVAGTRAVIVNAGQVIDVQGRLVSLRDRYSLPLERYCNQTVRILATYAVPVTEGDVDQPTQSETVPIVVVPATQAAVHSDRTYIFLSLVSVDANGKIISHSTSQRMQFQPGIIKGLTLKLNEQLNGLVIAPGLAVNQQGQLIQVGINDRIKFPTQRQTPLLLLLSRRLEVGKPETQERRGQQWQLELVPDTEAGTNQLPPDRFLPLVRLPLSQKRSERVEIASTSPAVMNGSLPATPIRPDFIPGVVWGLKVIAYPGQQRVLVTPGVAIGRQGETISVTTNQRLRLRGYANASIGLFLLYEPTLPNAPWRLTLATNRPQSPAIPLATLTLDDQGRLRDLPRDTRPALVPGILAALQVTPIAGDSKPQVAIAAGKAVDAQGRLLSISQDQTFDLSHYQGQTVLLFLSHHSRQGWQLGAVAEETSVGKIVLQDNATYGKANLQIRIPAEKQLYIVAANGYRPHIWGNLTVQGSDQPQHKPGELRLEGLLIEGQLTVLPGELAHLCLSHCTLVPQQGGLLVQTSTSHTLAIDPDEWSIIALAMYYVNLIAQLIALNLNPKLAPSQILTQLVQMGVQRMHYLITELWQLCCAPRSPLLGSFDRMDATVNNEQLTISINRSICGALRIDAAIEQLTISESMIDAGLQTDQRLAILAPHSPVMLANTTVFGGTLVLSLTATNSLFNELVTVWRKQIGCLRYCYVPDESQTPQRYHCQPDRQLEQQLASQPASVTALSTGVDAQNQLLLFAATATAGVWCSRDRGTTWEEMNDGLTNLQVQTLGIDTNQQRLYAGTTEGLIFSCKYDQYTQNQRLTWQLFMQVRSDVHPDLSSPNTTTINQILMQNGELFVATLGGRIFRSSDWTASQTGLENAIWTINALALDPQTGWLFAGTAGTGVYYSPDRGNTWLRPINLNLTNQTITALAIASNGRLFAGTTGLFTKDSGLYYSTNHGDTWTFVNLPLHQRNITAIAVHPDQDLVFASTLHGGLLRSQDQGQTWQALTNLPHRRITALAIAPNGWVLVGTGGGTLWRSTDRGQHWTPINQGFNQAEAKLSLLNQLQPSFTSTEYGNPGYAQLSLNCADELRLGAEDRSEIGGFNDLKQPQRIANLQAGLEEYARFGLAVNIIYIT
ncbi:MAG: WD40/YVTN/BNR-like repeat-containing protein [Stenomitos frigidus ULC029]